MTPTKLLIGQIFLVFTVVILSTWMATGWAAHMLGYQIALGSEWFSVGDFPVYYPWRLYNWWYAYAAYAPDIFDKAGLLAASGGILGILVAVTGSLWRARQNKNVTTYGSSRWAKKSEIKKAGLFNPDGVFIGKHGSHYLRHEGPEHVMAFAPTRSGKGVGLVIPTLLSWSESAVIHDIKGENWQLTSGWRSTFSHCLMFNPTDLKSAKFNPLLEVRKGPYEIRDVQNIADILVDPEGSLEKRNHWEKTSHALLVGAILHVLYADEEKTLARVATFLSDPERSFSRTLHSMMVTNHIGTDDNPEVHPVVASAARELLNKSDNERSGVLSTAMSFLGLYRDPIVAHVTSKSDWRIEDLMNAEHPLSLYLVVPPSDISRTKPLIRLMLNQIGRRLTENLEIRMPLKNSLIHVFQPLLRLFGKNLINKSASSTPYKHKLLMMLDEFPALGRLDFFETTLAFMAGYGIRAYLIAQSLNQIDKAYGENNAILDNCHVRITFATNDERTAKRISDGLGATTELKAQKNYAGHRLAPWLSHVMVSRQETARQLMTPGEVMQLPAHEQIVMLSGLPPIKAEKIKYFEDQNFTERVWTPNDLNEEYYSDAPRYRADDWTGRVRKAQAIFQKETAEELPVMNDGSSAEALQRHPAFEEKKTVKDVSEQQDFWAILEEDDELDVRNLDAASKSTPLQRAYGINQSDEHTEQLPKF